MPFYLAQLVTTLTCLAADVMFILGSSISIAKIFYITHFDWIFSLDQEFVCRLALGLSFLVGIPHLVIGVHQSAMGIYVSPAVGYFMGKKIVPQPFPPMIIYGSVWIFLSVLMLLIATLFIRDYKQRTGRRSTFAAENKRKKGKTVSLTTMLIGGAILSAAIIVYIVGQFYGLIDDFPIQLFLYAVIICGILVFFVLDANITKFALTKLNKTLPQLNSELKKSKGHFSNKIRPA